MNMDFRESGQVHYHAYTYVTKIDPYFKTCPGHHCLDDPPRSGFSEAIYAKQRNAANKPQKSWCEDAQINWYQKQNQNQ